MATTTITSISVKPLPRRILRLDNMVRSLVVAPSGRSNALKIECSDQQG
jgi:hypothetical protein